MLRLILMRHAKSDWTYSGVGDHERPLNARGKLAASALGHWLREKDYAPDQILCSSATRTIDTLARLDLSAAPQAEVTRALYLAGARDMLEVLNHTSGSTVLMLGHNPGICEMAHRLLVDPPSHLRFSDYPTGATLVCDFDVPTWMDVDWLSGRVVDFIVPRELTLQT